MLPICMQSQSDYHTNLWANYLRYEGQHQEAHKRFQQLVPHSIYSLPGYVHLLHSTQKYQEIVDLIPQVGTKFDNDAALQLLIIDALHKSNQSTRAYDKLTALHKKFPHDPQVVFAMANFAIANKELAYALEILNTLLNSSPAKANLFIFHFMKAQIYIQLNKPHDALASVKESLQLHDEFDKGWLMRAMLEEQLGNIQNAIQGYTHYLELSEDNNQRIADHLLQLAFKQKLSQQNRQTAFVQKSCFEQALALFEQKNYKGALAQVDHCLIQNSHGTKERLLKIEILTAMQQFNHAAAQLQAWINQDPHNELWFQALHLLSRQGAQLNTVVKTFEAIAAKHPTSHWAPLYLADLHMRTQQPALALTQLQKAAHIIQDPTLKSTILFQQGVLLFEQQQYDAMRTALEQAYALNADATPLLNLLAHYWATKGNNIDKAEQLITHACTKDQENPHLLDTKALILYKQKKYADAQQLLEKLLKNNPTDATILIHLAQVHHKQNNHQAAQNTLEQARAHTYSAYEKRKLKTLEKKLTQH